MGNPNEHHVILGAGAIGFAVARELAKRGARVRMVNRRGIAADAPDGVEIIAADLYRADEVQRVTQDAAVVYQSAQPQYHEWPEKFPPLQASILAGMTSGNAKLVIVENLYGYGETNGQPLTEDLPFNAQTRKGRVRAQMADAALAAHRAGNVRVTIGRGSDYFGPFGLNSGFGDRMFLPALAGKAAQAAGNLDVAHTVTFIDDFARALVILGEHDAALGQAWHVPNDRPTITQREFITLIFAELGLPPKMSALSRWMMGLAGLFIPAARETVEMMYEFEKPFVVDSSKFERRFGMKPTPIRDAIQQTVTWYREHAK